MEEDVVNADVGSERVIATVSFAIIELDDGLSVATIQPGQTPEEAATKAQGVLVDSGPYATYEEACDALCDLEAEYDESRE